MIISSDFINIVSLVYSVFLFSIFTEYHCKLKACLLIFHRSKFLLFYVGRRAVKFSRKRINKTCCLLRYLYFCLIFTFFVVYNKNIGFKCRYILGEASGLSYLIAMFDHQKLLVLLFLTCIKRLKRAYRYQPLTRSWLLVKLRFLLSFILLVTVLWIFICNLKSSLLISL